MPQPQLSSWPEPEFRTPAAVVTSVNVRLPLLRYKRLPGLTPTKGVSKIAETNQSIFPSLLKSPKAEPMPDLSVPTPAAMVPSVKVPLPLFQNNWLVWESEEITMSGWPSRSRSVNWGWKR